MSILTAHEKLKNSCCGCLLKGQVLSWKPQWDPQPPGDPFRLGREEQTQETPAPSTVFDLPWGGQVLVEEGVYMNEGRTHDL